ncbi:MAG: hypothetical protein JW723_04075 [Bacteroidales bacterium]|nr:hypothetical protein [Bacteroidales bacterium]
MEYHLLNKIYTFIDVIIHPGKRPAKTPGVKRCPVTGLDISMQPKNSKFLSCSGVKWYYENKRETYMNILEPRLTGTWKDKPLDRQFSEIAHAIRNSDSNPRNNTKRAVSRIINEKDTLFSNIGLIDKKILRKAGLV